jgi:hypothetical protein
LLGLDTLGMRTSFVFGQLALCFRSALAPSDVPLRNTRVPLPGERAEDSYSTRFLWIRAQEGPGLLLGKPRPLKTLHLRED